MNRLDLSSGLLDPETWILKNVANDLQSKLQSSKSIELQIESVIVFREAGQQFDSKIKINDIVSIKFSKPKKANSKS